MEPVCSTTDDQRGRRFAPNARRAHVYLFAATLMTAVAASAQPLPPSTAPGTRELFQDPVLASLVEQSLATRPELSAAQSIVRAERERVPQATALPDPMLQLGIQNDGFSNIEIGRMETSFVSVMATQPLPWPGKLRLRSAIASLGAKQAQSDVTRLRLSTEADVRRAYLELVLARDRLELLERLEAIWKNSAGVARARYEAGQGAQSDVLRSQLELGRIRQRRLALDAEANIRVQVLNRLRSHAADDPIEAAVHMRDFSVPPAWDEAQAEGDALGRSPELEAAKLGLVQAERSIALARRGYAPDFLVGAGIMPRGGELPPMWTVSIGATLPVFARSKQSRAVAESEARLQAARQTAAAVEQVLRLRVNERRTNLAALLETIRLYQQGLLVQSQATAESTLSQYKVSKVSFASVLEANAGLIADEEGYLQSLAAAQRIAIAAAEVSLAPMPVTPGGLAAGSMPGVQALGTGAGSALPGEPNRVGAAPSASMSSM